MAILHTPPFWTYRHHSNFRSTIRTIKLLGLQQLRPVPSFELSRQNGSKFGTTTLHTHRHHSNFTVKCQQIWNYHASNAPPSFELFRQPSQQWRHHLSTFPTEMRINMNLLRFKRLTFIQIFPLILTTVASPSFDLYRKKTSKYGTTTPRTHLHHSNFTAKKWANLELRLKRAIIPAKM